LFLYQISSDKIHKTKWKAILIGPKKAQTVASSVTENNPKIVVIMISNC
jgi:hypothetical protein